MQYYTLKNYTNQHYNTILFHYVLFVKRTKTLQTPVYYINQILVCLHRNILLKIAMPSKTFVMLLSYYYYERNHAHFRLIESFSASVTHSKRKKKLLTVFFIFRAHPTLINTQPIHFCWEDTEPVSLEPFRAFLPVRDTLSKHRKLGNCHLTPRTAKF